MVTRPVILPALSESSRYRRMRSEPRPRRRFQTRSRRGLPGNNLGVLCALGVSYRLSVLLSEGEAAEDGFNAERAEIAESPPGNSRCSLRARHFGSSLAPPANPNHPSARSEIQVDAACDTMPRAWIAGPPSRPALRTRSTVGIRTTTVLIAALLTFLTDAFAGQPGVVTGTALDQTGAALPGVTIDLVSSSGQLTAVTDGAGGYRFEAVPSGSAELTYRLIN